MTRAGMRPRGARAWMRRLGGVLAWPRGTRRRTHETRLRAREVGSDLNFGCKQIAAVRHVGVTTGGHEATVSEEYGSFYKCVMPLLPPVVLLLPLLPLLLLLLLLLLLFLPLLLCHRRCSRCRSCLHHHRSSTIRNCASPLQQQHSCIISIYLCRSPLYCFLLLTESHLWPCAGLAFISLHHSASAH
jgi:hypothetical protein